MVLSPLTELPEALFAMACASDSNSSSPAASTTGNRHATRRLRVIVVDDEQRIADSVKDILADSGHAAVAVYDGLSAVNIAKESCPDVLLCDVLMPEMNGVETAVAIRQLCPHARVLLFSGHASVSDIVSRARAAGHHFEFLPKPIRPTELLQKLSH